MSMLRVVYEYPTPANGLETDPVILAAHCTTTK